jgi:broad specificity phosphatase PhoE
VTEIVVARHGETDWNAESRFQGHADPPLNDRGRAQARALAERLADAGVAAVYSSDLRRAAETAAVVAARLGLTVAQDSRLREIDVGEWSGLTVDEVADRFPEGYRRHREGGDGWENGESHAALTERIVGAVRRIAAAHADETVLLIAHGAALRALLADAEGVDLSDFRRTRPPIENGSFARLAWEDGNLRRLD